MPATINVRHVMPSYLLSLDDEPYAPTPRLIDLGLAAARGAADLDLSALAARFPPDTARFIDVWPGEHYRLLAALIEEVRPSLVVEIGTATGASCLAMKEALPPQGKIVTYDIIPWQRYPGSGLRQSDFDGRLEQRVIDLTKDEAIAEIDLLRSADVIFVDAAKDGQMEQTLCDLFDMIRFHTPPLVIFDDTRLQNMIAIWRTIRHPKLDLTSFGHWSGTGLVEWI